MVGQENTNKLKHFGRDIVRDKKEPSLGQTKPLHGTNWDPSLRQTGRFLLNSRAKSPCPVCPWDGSGFVPLDDCPARTVRTMWRRPRFLPTFLASCKAKAAYFSHFEAKREKGISRKEDQNWSCSFWSKSALFPQFQTQF